MSSIQQIWIKPKKQRAKYIVLQVFFYQLPFYCILSSSLTEKQRNGRAGYRSFIAIPVTVGPVLYYFVQNYS